MRCGLPALVAEKVKLTGAKNGAGTAAEAKTMSIVGGMAAGTDSIDDLDVLRHGGLARLFGGVRAPSTLGTFLRAFTWGHVRQLDSAVRAFTCNVAAHTGLVPTGDEVVFVDIGSKVKQVYGPAKQGASFGYTKQRGLHFQIVTVKTSTCAPVIVATRLRKGSANSGKGAASLLREALKTVRAMGVTTQIIVRADSAYFSHKVVAVCRTARCTLLPCRRGQEENPRGHRHHRRGCLDAGHVCRRRLRRRGGTLDLRRGDHRSPVHGVHQ